MKLVDTTKAIQRAVGVEPDGVWGPLSAAAVWRRMSAEDGDGVDVVGGDADEQPELDERTLKNLATLDGKVRERFYDFTLLAKATAASYGCEYVIICGHRTWEEQDALYALGRTKPGDKVTNARGGYSNHNFGIAADYGVFRGRSYLDEKDAKLAAAVHAAAAVHGRKLGLAWGGDWKGLKDYPHYEIMTGLTLAEKRQMWSERGRIV